jgi:hypothetical protein
MMAHRWIAAIVCGLAVCLAVGHASARSAPASPQKSATLDELLKGYLGGDAGIVGRTFQQPGDFQARLKLSEPRVLERWLGSFDPGKAVFLLALARQGVDVAPHYAGLLLTAGRRYVGPAGAGDAALSEADFALVWHRAAAGLLEAIGNPTVIEEYVEHVGAGSRGASTPTRAVDARLVLARAVAQEWRCWAIRPSLDQAGVPTSSLTKAAGVTVRADLDGARKATRAKDVSVHTACLQDLVPRLEAARALADTRAEAGVRGGWTLFQLGQPQDALAWLDGSATGRDAELSYWRDLFRGRVLDGLDRHVDAAAAYRAAFDRYPAAQAAGIGLALELVRLTRPGEADEVVRAVRAAGAAAPDPWTRYFEADRRFVDGWIDLLRAVAR